jgi:hypothetical protein
MKNTVYNYPNWEAILATKTDQQLVETFNHGVQLRVWGTARMKYIHCLKNEILDRNWDASILFSEDKNTFSLAKRVVLENGKLKFQD